MAFSVVRIGTPSSSPHTPQSQPKASTPTNTVTAFMRLVRLVNHLPLERGMYPMLVLAGGLALYSFTTVLGGSGFLAVYLAGVVVGNSSPRESTNIQQVHNGLVWLAQIAMFLMLGLLASPSDLLEHAPSALAIALVLMFVARPLAVALCLLPFHFPWREQVFIAWVGLRGAVPIILALFPLLAGIPEAELILDVAFFVVLISLTVQGWTIPALARRLRLEVPPAPTPTERFDLASAPAGGHAFFGYRVKADGQFTGRPAGALRLPGEARLLTVLRDGVALVPEAAGELAAGDTLYVLANEADSAALGDLLATPRAPAYLDKRQFYGDFILNGESIMANVAAQYGLPLPPEMSDLTLEAFIVRKLPGVPVVGDRVRLGKLEFVVRAIVDGRIRQVGLRIPTHLVDAP